MYLPSQQEIITLLVGVKKRIPCRALFNKLNILPFTTAHLFWLLILLLTTWQDLKQIFK